MKNIPTTSFAGKSGKTYIFTVYDIDYECPDDGGVYVFCKKPPVYADNISYKPIYFGITGSFVKRFYYHHKDRCIIENGADSLCLLRISDEENRAWAERDLLAVHNTTCNYIYNTKEV